MRNDITHGGDGLFIRALNGWVSTGNVFVENDCSVREQQLRRVLEPGEHLHPEPRQPRQLRLLARRQRPDRARSATRRRCNGLPDGNHNAPEAGFGHGGIVIVGGSSTHTRDRGELLVHHNAGRASSSGATTRRRAKAWRTQHWIVQRNVVEGNRFGIWGRWGADIHLGNNVFRENAEGNFLDDVTGLVEASDPAVTRPPLVDLVAPVRAVAGRPVLLDATRSRDPGGLPLRFLWDLDGTVAEGPSIERAFDKVGFHRVGLTVTNGALADLAWRELIVTREVQEVGTEGQASLWGFEMQGNDDGKGRVSFDDDSDAVCGRSSLRFTADPYKGMYATAIFPEEPRRRLEPRREDESVLLAAGPERRTSPASRSRDRSSASTGRMARSGSSPRKAGTSSSASPSARPAGPGCPSRSPSPAMATGRCRRPARRASRGSRPRASRSTPGAATRSRSGSTD